jgi:uncharacterized protein (TIGR02246 family)
MALAETPDMVFRLWAEAFNRADGEGMAEMFEDGAILLLPPGDRLIRGREQISQAALAIATTSHFTIHNIDVLENGDLAMVYVTRTRTTTQPDAEPRQVTGTTTDVVRRQPDGRWLIVIDNPNGSHVPGPADPPSDHEAEREP